MSEYTVRDAKVVYTGRAMKISVSHPRDVADFVRRKIGRAAREHFFTIWLDGRNRPLASDLVSIGTATASLVHPAQIFQGPLIAGACSIIMAHNHPSGVSSPSSEDKEVTERLAEVGKIVGVRLLDHVIVGRADYYSFSEAGGID
ncbi:hypothetical protein LCGC14_1184800 [marine sediment metagenome]|uniref:MPN domain-containing protein n=1 Tax=marine sediment metagenome TaxID=412755 RepID=A0A0F9LL93_9ZZZZ